MDVNDRLDSMQLVAVYGSWHLGQLQVGLSKAIRLTQCSSIRITTHHTLPMQLDGEPWLQAPATLQVRERALSLNLQFHDLAHISPAL